MMPEKIYPKRKKDLFSLKIMGSFFSGNYSVPGFKTVKLTKITSVGVMTKNLVISYELQSTQNKTAASIRVWGKTMRKDTYALLDFISQTKAGKYLPLYFKYIDSLELGLYLDIGGKSIDNFKKNYIFWKENAGRLGFLIADLQNLKIPSALLKTYAIKDERKFIKNSLRKINNYSADEGNYYGSLTKLYLNGLSDKCLVENEFTFNHFDAQQSNIYFNEDSKSLGILDFELAKKFHPAMDPANFLVHVYVMLRYHHSKKDVMEIIKLFLAGYVSRSRTKKNKFSPCLEILKIRAMFQVAQITAKVFGKPNENSRKVFKILKELHSHLWLNLDKLRL